MIGADVGVDTTLAIIERIQYRVKKDKYVSTSELNQILYQEIANLLIDTPQDLIGFQVPEAKNWTKVIKAVRSPKTGAYTFKESIVYKDNVKEFLAAK